MEFLDRDLLEIVENKIDDINRKNNANAHYWYPLNYATYGSEEITSALQSMLAFKTSMSDKCKLYENSFSNFIKSNKSIFVNSGSSANLLCLAYLKEKFPQGGKVIVPPFTWSSDISSVMWMGFEPHFVDVRLETLGLNGDLVIEEIESNNDVRAVFLTHAQGLNGLDENLRTYLNDKEIILIEDVC